MLNGRAVIAICTASTYQRSLNMFYAAALIYTVNTYNAGETTIARNKHDESRSRAWHIGSSTVAVTDLN